MNVPQKIYTDQDLARARKRGKLIGWLQGGAIVIAAGIAWNLLGWIPIVVVVGAMGYVGYKALSKGKAASDASP